jgi:Na+-translocating ferredoxin:NAD+ oxidoreductase RNF subunit RnfB
MRHTRLRSHTNTKYIELNRGKCQACWKCVELCPNGVLGKVIFFGHRHAHVTHADACKGCKKCVNGCPNHAIRYTYMPPSHRLHDDDIVAARLEDAGHVSRYEARP